MEWTFEWYRYDRRRWLGGWQELYGGAGWYATTRQDVVKGRG